MADSTADQIATLGKWVETQSLGDTHDGDSTANLVAGLGREIGDISVSVSRAGAGTYKETLEKSGVQMPNRRTPYEVWADKQKAPAKKPPARLKNKDVNSLVSKLHSSNKKKEQTIMSQSNANLAYELQHLAFRPELNKKSREESKTVKPLLERQQGMMDKREADLRKQRQQSRNREMEECTFSPNLMGIKKGEKYLKRSGKAVARSTDDILQWEKDKETRRLQRKQIVEEMEEAELSFAPHLNRRSLQLTEKLKKEGKYQVDPATRQTINSPRRFADSAGSTLEEKQKAGHEEETFKPQINNRSVSSDGRSVHRRLYEEACKKRVIQHNEQLELKKTLLKSVPQKAWENDKMVHGGASPWVVKSRQTDSMAKNRSFSQDTFIDDTGEPPINVLEYNQKYNFILEKIRFGGT
ncbi:hypothetical protein TrVE_jg4069 [Triparma verrucosa]|jgi:hypothetical protein|uniref:Uncharacterized protein n=2 Tax=Triparma TaxID=722752 RepID=A0A9W6ZER3_9STRA|nr:hypothetical protein TrST_g8589 [Triparma strigata]GMH88850.1 hypothetical protein TrVE_jg4069 [Triparma verrucosa]|mmetsp:Transcript_2064/g.3716  ORF Transcript_2064/g.3716 Transcript_2064/m.3716 type:complete len:412 (-) Transcript_2064:21-1256(-)|eukprot:CAMPEP_0182491560 /NCGR_PEP_ID=MMETSP1321-20130603/946_1 /TAXON_ID=91990 /ORGANISM="Bolidomonas sp., Strain RCC1657" /LENGTH=411 /DNA_ID=CAMNT_0024693841 /DNA_START=14 /DNA_END=1249 /DNA_ORIENTATION=-